MSPDVVEELRRLELEGTITPERVVEAAKDEANPLHDAFEWDNTKASHAYRIIQARRLISNVRVSFRVETKTVEAVYYVRDPDKPSTEQGYRSVPSLRESPESAHEAVAAEFSRAAACLQRAKSIAEVLDCAKDVERIYDEIVQMRDMLREHRPSA